MSRTRTARNTSRIVLSALTVVALTAHGPVSAQDRDHREDAARIYTLAPSTDGNPEGIAFDRSSGAFFVGATGSGSLSGNGGTIYRGTIHDPTVRVFIPGAPGMEAVGLKVARGRLYVAGGFSGAVRVYDIATKGLVALFENFGAGMLNDLVVTRSGDVFVTDSFVPVLWRITSAQVATGGGAPEGIPLDPEIEWDFSPFAFNLNGIVSLNCGRRLIVVQSSTGKLFRIDLDRDAPLGRSIHQIEVEPLFGDGLLLDKGYLIVVTFAPAALSFVELDDRLTRGTVVERRIPDVPFVFDPSTVTRARNLYLVVNADFATSTTPFKVVGLPRNDDNDDE